MLLLIFLVTDSTHLVRKIPNTKNEEQAQFKNYQVYLLRFPDFLLDESVASLMIVLSLKRSFADSGAELTAIAIMKSLQKDQYFSFLKTVQCEVIFSKFHIGQMTGNSYVRSLHNISSSLVKKR